MDYNLIEFKKIPHFRAGFTNVLCDLIYFTFSTIALKASG